MVYVTGDIHGNPFSRFNSKNFPEGKALTKTDYVIILGDFGCIWGSKGTDTEEQLNSEKYKLDWLNEKPWTTIFVDGNHENHMRLNNEFPVVRLNGSKVHRIRNSVYHLMRGEVIMLDGKKFFAFGGAASHDIQDGILKLDNWEQEAKKLIAQNKQMFRVEGLSWWPEESPSQEEMDYGIKNLEIIGYDVDFIITHDAPTEFKYVMGFFPNDMDNLNDYLQKIANRCSCKTKFYCGHYHENSNYGRFNCLYERIERIV